MGLKQTVARNIRTLRVARGYTQEELSGLAGINRNYTGMIEREQRSPTVDTELSPIVGDGLGRSGGGGRLMVDRFGDDLDPVVECHTQDQFWQLVVTIETAP
jgi:DNA-binding XRE family transcriptional regulator